MYRNKNRRKVPWVLAATDVNIGAISMLPDILMSDKLGWFDDDYIL